MSSSSVTLGQRVTVRGETGIIKFVGKTQFSPGTWVGIELDTSIGKNNGTVNGVKYFDCDKHDDNYGIFVRPSLLGTPNASPKLSESSHTVSDLHIVIDKLQLKLKNATEDIKDYKQTVDQLKKELSKKQILISKLESNLEMVSIDKDYLNETNNQLKSDLQDFQNKYQNLKNDFDIIQEELDINKQLEEAIKNSSTSFESEISEHDFKFIVLRNNQLELALTNLQKITDDQKLNFEKEIADLRQSALLHDDQLNNYDQLSQKLESSEMTIHSLQSQLDSALELEKIIEHLTRENEQLLFKVNKLNDTVNELSELHELDKSLEESQSHIEYNLRNDINSLSKIIQDDKLLINDLERKNKYLENKFLEFKEKSIQSNRNSSITLNPEYNDEDLIINDLSSQIESLKLEIKKQRSSSFADKISLKIAQTKLNLLEQFDSSSISTNLNLKHGYEVLYIINLNIAYTSMIIETIETLSNNQEIQFRLSNLSRIKLDLKFLFSFLQSIAHLWEYNYATKHYVNVIISFKNILNELNDNLLISIDHIKEGDIDNLISTSYVKVFITESFDLLKLNFVNDTYSIIFQNISLFKIWVSNISHESSENVYLLKYMLSYLDRYFQHINQPDELISELYNKLNTLLELGNELKNDSSNLVNELQYASENSKDLTIKISNQFDLEDISSGFNLLSKILKKIELEDYLISDPNDFSQDLLDLDSLKDTFEFDYEVESWGTLDSVLESYNKNQQHLKSDFESYEKQAQSIYDSVNDISSHKLVHDDKKASDLRDKQSIELKYSDLSNKLLEKDGAIQDLQLNVRLLEKNMASSDAKSKEYIDKLKQELSTIKKDHEGMKKNYDVLLKSNKELEFEIQEVLKSNQVFETSHLLGKFSDLQSEKKFTEEMALIEEVLLLRKMVNLKYNQFAGNAAPVQDADDLKWLDQSILHSPPSSSNTSFNSVSSSHSQEQNQSPNHNQNQNQSQHVHKQSQHQSNQNEKAAYDFKNSASKIRTLAKEAHPVKVPNRAGAWRPRANIPKYVTSLIEEQKKQYQHDRHSSISSSFN